MKLNYRELYQNLLTEYEKFSTCNRLHVASLLVNKGRILSCGYNGVPSGDHHCNEIFTKGKDNDYFYINGLAVDEETWRTEHHKFSEANEIHAEMNCLAFAIKNNIPISNCELIVSKAPCTNCAKLILTTGIKKVYYSEEYDRGNEGLEFLKNHGVLVQKL